MKTVKTTDPYCGAGLPNRDADADWHWCGRDADHLGSHRDGGVCWYDDAVTEVIAVTAVRAVPAHAHSFVGDRCTALDACPITWAQWCSQMDRRKAFRNRGKPPEPRDEHVLVDEIISTARSRAAYSERGYAAMFEELVASVTRRVQREEREEVVRTVKKLYRETNEAFGPGGGSNEDGIVAGMGQVELHLCAQFGFEPDGSPT